MNKGLGTDLGGLTGGGHEGGSHWISVGPRCRFLMKIVELERGGRTLNTPSSCEASLNTVALFDPGLVSSSRFRSRMLTPYPLLPVNDEIALFPWGRLTTVSVTI